MLQEHAVGHRMPLASHLPLPADLCWPSVPSGLTKDNGPKHWSRKRLIQFLLKLICSDVQEDKCSSGHSAHEGTSFLPLLF